MVLSRETILEKKFSTVRKGYDCLAVDSFLDELSRDADDYNARLSAKDAELARYREMESSICSSLVTAQAAAERTKKEAADEVAQLKSQVDIELATLRANAEEELAAQREQANREISKKTAEAEARIDELNRRRDSLASEIEAEHTRLSAELAEKRVALADEINALKEYAEDYKRFISAQIDSQKQSLDTLFAYSEPPVDITPKATAPSAEVEEPSYSFEIADAIKSAPSTQDELKNMISQLYGNN